MPTVDELERILLNDLQTLRDMVERDDSFDEDLYRALTGTQWHREGGGHVSFSFKRAEEIVNGQRARKGLDPLTLNQTGGEGTVSERIAGGLRDQGWNPRPLDPDVHDDSHIDSRPDAPPRGSTEAPEWERQAHAEADENRY
jgi:hypothetical protein